MGIFFFKRGSIFGLIGNCVQRSHFDVNLTISSPMWQTVVQIISCVFPLYAEEVQPSENQTVECSDLASLSTSTTAP